MDGRTLLKLVTLGALAALAHSCPVAAQVAVRPTPNVYTPAQAEPATLPLAAGGYCVTSLRDRREWIPGDMAVGVQFDGRNYAFASARQRDIFMAAPAVYAPVLSGDCPVTFAETGQRIPGKVEFGVVHGGRIYFFATNEARTKFAADPAKFASADLADGGRCIVSRVESRREVAGLPETAVLVGGMRRLFAGAYEQRLYLQQPKRYDPASTAPPATAIVAVATPAPGSVGSWKSAADGAANKPAEPTLADSPAGGAPTPADASMTAEPAMGGYCPVTFHEKGAWVRGRHDARAEIDGVVFFTAGTAERDALLADPAKYLPALAGNCAVSLVDDGQNVRGSTFHAAQFEGRLYLFVDAERKATFKEQPRRYASIDVAASGACVVTLKDGGKNTPGLAEYAVWYNGLLYRFLGPEEKAKFLAAPDKYAERREAGQLENVPPAQRADGQ
jgi:YHS domain-containing protein